jgi:hypothetical protein
LSMFYPHPQIALAGMLFDSILARRKTTAPTPDMERRLFAAGPSAFWLDPRRWDGIGDTHSELFWMKRRPDVIDIHSGDEDDPSGCIGY